VQTAAGKLNCRGAFKEYSALEPSNKRLSDSRTLQVAAEKARLSRQLSSEPISYSCNISTYRPCAFRINSAAWRTAPEPPDAVHHHDIGEIVPDERDLCRSKHASVKFPRESEAFRVFPGLGSGSLSGGPAEILRGQRQLEHFH
jgi:hypothetical protein